MAYPKFDEAAYCKNGSLGYEIIPLDVLNELKTKDNSNFIKNYEGNLFCPECFKPQLTLVHNSDKNIYFLRGYPKQQHEETCSKAFELVNNGAFDELLQDQESFDFINNKLHKLIDKMVKKSVLSLKNVLIKVEKNKCIPDEVTDEEIKSKKNVKVTPIKSITTPFEDDDFDRYKLFYGNVDLIVKEQINKSNKESFFTLNLYKKGSKFHICNLAMNKNVAWYLMKKYELECDRIYSVYISFATIFKQRGIFKNGKVYHTDLCLIEKE